MQVASNQHSKVPTFRAYLQEELLRRCRTNRGYSLRSFARTLEISTSSLSRILRGERKMSLEIKIRLGAHLGISTLEVENLNQNELDKHSNELKFHQLAADTFAI